MEWMILPYRRYFDFSGRSRRQEYWMFTLLWVLAIILGVVLIIVGFATNPGGESEPGPLGWLSIAALVIFLLASIIPGIAVTVRRFHDQNLSGWMYLLGFIPSVGGLIIIVFMCLDGNPNENRFGHDPKGRGHVGVFD